MHSHLLELGLVEALSALPGEDDLHLADGDLHLADGDLHVAKDDPGIVVDGLVCLGGLGLCGFAAENSDRTRFSSLTQQLWMKLWLDDFLMVLRRLSWTLWEELSLF